MRRIWLTLSLVVLVGGASAFAQDVTNKNTKNNNKNVAASFDQNTDAANKAARKSDPRAIAFLKNKVDKTMYNLIDHGVRDAVVRMRLPLLAGLPA